MLTIWSSDQRRKILKALGPVLSPDSQLEFTATPQVSAETKLVLALGNEPLAFLMNLKMVPKGRKVTSLRKKVWQCEAYPRPVMFSYSAGISEVNYPMYTDLLTDATMAMRYAATGSLQPQLGKYTYVTDLWDVYKAAKKRHIRTGKPVRMSYDLETVGLDPYAGKHVVSVQVSIEAGTAFVCRFASHEEAVAKFNDLDFKAPLAALLTAPWIRTVAANGKYDFNWTYLHAAIDCSNFSLDTTLVGSLLDENRSNALDVHTKIYVPGLGGYSDEFDRLVDKSRMDLVPADQLLTYAGADADATLQVAERMIPELMADKKLTRFYVNLLHPAARAYEHVERTGVLVDQAAYAQLASDLLKVMQETTVKAKKLVGGIIVARNYNKKEPEKFNLMRKKFIVDYLFSPLGLNLKPLMFTEGSDEDPGGIKVPSTAIEHLMMFKKHPDAKAFIEIIAEYQDASKTMSTYVAGRDKNGDIVKGFLAHLRSDGRFHPSYFMHKGNQEDDEGGTVTGRLSARDPAFQTVPKHTKWAKALRRCFIAPQGFVIGSRDFSQGELRITACVSNEPTMIQAYRDGMDLHALTAGRFSGYDYPAMMAMAKDNPDLYDEIRQLGKAGNFGLIYGMQLEGFLAYAEANYGVELSMEEGAKFIDGFFDTYTQLHPWHGRQIELATKQGFVRSPLGRIRHLPLIHSPIWSIRSKAERQSINSPVQATLSDLSLLATAEEHKRGWHLQAPTFGMVHDQMLNYVPEDRAEEYMKRGKELMENLPLEQVFGWKPQLKFVVDCSVGPNMADQKKLKWEEPLKMAA